MIECDRGGGRREGGGGRGGGGDGGGAGAGAGAGGERGAGGVPSEHITRTGDGGTISIFRGSFFGAGPLRIRSVRCQCAVVHIAEKRNALVVAPKDVPRGSQWVGIDCLFENIVGKFSTNFRGRIETGRPVRYNSNHMNTIRVIEKCAQEGMTCEL